MSATLAISPAATLLRPPTPEPAPDDLTPLQVAVRMRRNGISVWARRAYEDDIVIRRFFGRRSLLINAPEGIRNVLIDRTDKYVRTTASIRILRPMLGEGLLLSEGRAWRHQRRTLAPAFSPKAISLLVPHMLSAADEAIAALRARSSEPVDLFSALQRLTLEIAGRTMFSLEMKESGGRLREFVMRYSRRLARPHLLDLLLPLDIPSPHDVARFWFRRQWRAFLDGIIRKRREAASSAGVPRDLFDLLLAARDPETGQSFSADQLRDQVATLILAGHETTAIALFWSLYLLALSPDTQEQLAEESVCAGEARGLDAFVRTRAVLDEAMRLYPPAFVIARAAREPDEVCGVRVEPGDLAIVSPWVLHRHRRHWSDPDAFRPERFLRGGPAIDRFAYLPFGVGPRICIGAQFALTEATLVLSRLLGSFRIEPVDTAPVMPVAVVTTQPDRHPLFRLTPR